MWDDAPFDVWDGEERGLTEAPPDEAVEEAAMHVDPEWEVGGDGRPPWSDLIDDGDDEPEDRGPVTYFSDEQPERLPPRIHAREEPEPDLEELLERQHYAFPPAPDGRRLL